MHKYMDNVRLRIKIASWALTGALTGLSMLLAWLMIGCGPALLKQSTRLDVSVYPAHNEDINNVSGGVEKFIADFSQKFRIYDRFEVDINPVYHMVSDWPVEDYKPDGKILENKLTARIYIVKEYFSVYWTKKRYFISEGGRAATQGINCNCTMANQFGFVIEIPWR